MADVLQFDEADHVYTLGGRVLPSVTQIIAPLRPDLTMIPPDVLERKRALGVAVHLACQLDDDDELDEDALDDELRPYLAGWRKFKADTGAVILMNEQRLHHPTLGYAGTLDRLAELRMHAGAPWLIDLKTSADPLPSYGVQTAGYDALIGAHERGPMSEAFAELFARIGVPSAGRRRGTVHLRPDGTYRLHEYKNPNDEAAFRACLSLHHWKESAQ